jgi:hypothetical protein
MDYKNKYLKYKKKYLQLRGGAYTGPNLINDPNLQKYSINFENYQVIIYGEHHYDFDYTDFVEKLKVFLQNNSDKKYVIVLEIPEDILTNPHSSTSGDTNTSISYLLAKNDEFKSLTNVTFISGDNRTENFDRILDGLEHNIIDFPEDYLQSKLSDEDNEELLDISTIESYWEDEKKQFIGDEYTNYKNIIDKLLKEVNGKNIKFKNLEFLLHKLYFIWFRISNIWTLNKIKEYMNNDFNIIFITGLLHLPDYIYLIDQQYKSTDHLMCDKYKVTPEDRNNLFAVEPYYGEKFNNFYNEKCKFVKV